MKRLEDIGLATNPNAVNNILLVAGANLDIIEAEIRKHQEKKIIQRAALYDYLASSVYGKFFQVTNGKMFENFFGIPENERVPNVFYSASSIHYLNANRMLTLDVDPARLDEILTSKKSEWQKEISQIVPEYALKSKFQPEQAKKSVINVLSDRQKKWINRWYEDRSFSEKFEEFIIEMALQDIEKAKGKQKEIEQGA